MPVIAADVATSRQLAPNLRTCRSSRPATGGAAGALLNLQRSVGNSAVTALLNRRPTAPPAGSTAPDSEEQSGPVGNAGLLHRPGADLPDRPAGQTAGRAPDGGPATEPMDAPPRDAGAPDAGAPLSITSATAKAAPSGAASTRTQVGVGEVVTFTGSSAGTWTASAGTPASTRTPAATFAWTAPATAQTVDITLTVPRQSTNVSTTVSMTVVAPASIAMRNVGSHTAQLGSGGACMLTEVTFNPTTVCLGAIQWLEVPGPASSIDGFFKKFSASTLKHNPNTHYAIVNDSNVMEAGTNNGPNDHCAWHALPGPYKDGTFTWVIPNRYIIDGEPTSSGRHFFDTRQVFTMDAAGKLTITKAGATT